MTVSITQEKSKRQAISPGLAQIQKEEKEDREHVARTILSQQRSNSNACVEPGVQKLRNAIEHMDSLSQGGFSEIASMAKLALSRMETLDGYQHLDDIANALLAIWGKADDTQNLVNCEAEDVGCSHTDVAKQRRWAALSANRDMAGD